MIRGIIGGLLYPNVQIDTDDPGRVTIILSAIGMKMTIVARDKRKDQFVPSSYHIGMPRKIGDASFRAWGITAWTPGVEDDDG